MSRNQTVDTSDFSFDVMDSATLADPAVMARPTANGEPSLYVVNDKVVSKLMESWDNDHKPLSVNLPGRQVKALVAGLRASAKHLQATTVPRMGLSLKWTSNPDDPAARVADMTKVPDDATPVWVYFAAVERKDFLTDAEQLHARELGFVMPEQKTRTDENGKEVKYYDGPTMREAYRKWQKTGRGAPNQAPAVSVVATTEPTTGADEWEAEEDFESEPATA